MNYESKRKFYHYVDLEEARQLKKRVAHLEEETHKMMQEMSQNREERKTLLNEVYRKLKLVQFSVHSKYTEGGRADGLSQVLYEDLNPSVVIRGGSRANLMAASSREENTTSNILCLEYNN
ncbi:hypothetical protein LXL04_009181 [Taraxacum kok-saghyz]